MLERKQNKARKDKSHKLPTWFGVKIILSHVGFLFLSPVAKVGKATEFDSVIVRSNRTRTVYRRLGIQYKIHGLSFFT